MVGNFIRGRLEPEAMPKNVQRLTQDLFCLPVMASPSQTNVYLIEEQLYGVNIYINIYIYVCVSLYNILDIVYMGINIRMCHSRQHESDESAGKRHHKMSSSW